MGDAFDLTTPEGRVAWDARNTLSGSKYNNRRTEVHGAWFDSRKEAERYIELLHLEAAGEIGGIELQPTFPVEINGVHVFTYRADFRYTDATGVTVVEDVKGYRTQVYKLKKRCVEAYHGIEISEV